MSTNDHHYHAERERQCRSMASRADDPEVRRRHEHLASLHAERASLFDGITAGGDELGAI